MATLWPMMSSYVRKWVTVKTSWQPQVCIFLSVVRHGCVMAACLVIVAVFHHTGKVGRLRVGSVGMLCIGLATIPIYSYNHIDYGRLPYKKQVLPVWAWVPAISIPYTYRMSVYGHTIQLLHQQSWLQTILKFQMSKFMNYKLNRNQICASFRLPIHKLYKNGCTISSHCVNSTVTGP